MMWGTPAMEQSQLFDTICKFEGEDQPMMDSEVNEQQPKQERLRTRWTPSLDKIFADIVVEQIRQGNRPNNVFDKKTWNLIREEFNGKTNLSFNNNQLRKHLDVLRIRYHNIKSTFNQTDVMEDPCYIGFDLWEDIGAQSKTEGTKIKECPVYEQLCTIFADSGSDGKYAQSSHYEGVDKSAGADPSGPEGGNQPPKTPSSRGQGNGSSPPNLSKNIAADKKRKRPSETGSESAQITWNQELSNAMAQSMLEMLASSKVNAMSSQIDKRFTITNCIKALDEMEGIEDGLYYAALDLFEDRNLRETFLSLSGNYIRLSWLQGKCGAFAPFAN